MGRIERRSNIRNSIRTMGKRNPEHHDGVRGAASYSPFIQVIRRLSGFGRTAQSAAGSTIFFGNVLYQAVIVVLFDGEMNDHPVENTSAGKK
jgi:hypothetical protein